MKNTILKYIFTFSVLYVSASAYTLKLESNTTTLNVGEKASLTLIETYSDNNTKTLDENVTYIINPPQNVEVNGSVITALKDDNVTVQAKVGTTLSNTLNLNITWIVNGHVLPPEPDPVVSNSTLLGIDSNGNGVRDDVERLIIIEESKNTEYPKIQTAIALQYAWAWQKMIESPTLETRQYLEKASACQWYFLEKHTKNIQDYIQGRKWRKAHSGKLGVNLEDKIFNTKERILQRFKFNEACSGNIFNMRKAELEACQTNIDNLGE
jgi:hypothetical protein